MRGEPSHYEPLRYSSPRYGSSARYPELAMVTKITAIFGRVLIVLGILLPLFGLFQAQQVNGPPVPFLLAYALWGVGTAAYGLLMIALSQVLQLLMDIERNTRRATEADRPDDSQDSSYTPER